MYDCVKLQLSSLVFFRHHEERKLKMRSTH